MKDINHPGKTDRINGAVGTPTVIFDDFEDTRSLPFLWLRMRVFGTELS
jgi:hypothetical protein